ncbi:50S ribosomal protein L18 [Candidatus Woesearchaeota archaeon]|nr:50S ribosomal protein L18 [Candidatus Woesearchaeota archaeon]
MKKTRFTVKFKRRRKGITNYKKRLKILLVDKPRLVIRKSLNNTNTQIIEYAPQGDKVIVAAHSSELKKYGWNATGNAPSAYLTGVLLGQKAKKKGIKEAILDLGLSVPTKGGRLYAALRGVIDTGISVPHSKEILPPDDRIKGMHVINYSNLLKADKAKFEKQFSAYIKSGADPAKSADYFDNTKKKISEA